MGKPKAKGKTLNTDSPVKEDSRTTFFAQEDNQASNQTELATDATTRITKTPSSHPTLANILATIGTLKENNYQIQWPGLKIALHSNLPY